ncbi:hypothetical protein D2Q93_09905 [Alicyclobacillaceae bacterium I2511]|nr:hypothetical protein D2Q93_09905 [Alicyclobacillaceae bacterium I2511]
MHKFLVHKRGDHVGVVTSDIERGDRVTGVFMDDNSAMEVVAGQSIPLGHKIALVSHGDGEEVVEYGQIVGVTTQSWSVGDYVHTHNIRSKRWS